MNYYRSSPAFSQKLNATATEVARLADSLDIIDSARGLNVEGITNRHSSTY